MKELDEITGVIADASVKIHIRLMNLPVGLLINFGAATLKQGLDRIVNHLPTSASPRLRVNQSES